MGRRDTRATATRAHRNVAAALRSSSPTCRSCSHAAKAICALMRGQPAPLYRGTANAMFVPIGPSGGVGELPMLGGMMLGDFAVSTMKGKDYFVGTVRKIMRAK